MIISKKIERDKLFDTIKDYDSFFLVGCSECASLCGTGGEPELEELKKELEAAGKKVTGTFRAKTGCQVLGTKIELKPFKEELADTQVVIVMSCGAGTQAMVEVFPDKPVYPSNDSMFLGNMTRFQMFDERCSLCGECILEQTGGICPVTNCPKGLLNGPCGGTSNGNCEVSPDIKCAWVQIYQRLEKINRLEDMEKIIEPKDWSKGQKPQVLSARPKKEGKKTK